MQWRRKEPLMPGRINRLSASMLILFYALVAGFGYFMTFYVVPAFGG